MGWGLKQEVGRKLIHFSSLLILLFYFIIFIYFGEDVAMFSLLVFLLIFLVYEYLRIDLKLKLPFTSFMRKKEQKTMSASVFVVLAIIVCLTMFNLNMAAAAILMATFSDVITGLVGREFKQTRISTSNKKTKESIIYAFIINLIIGYILLPHWIIILAMSASAITIETITRRVEDNLAVPIITGFIGHILLFVL